MKIKGVGGEVIKDGQVIAKINDWSFEHEIFEPYKRLKFHDFQNMSYAELLGILGARHVGWSLAQLELARRGVNIRPHETAVIVEYDEVSNITKSLHTLKSEVVHIWGRLCKSLFFKAKKRAHPKINKKR